MEPEVSVSFFCFFPSRGCEVKQWMAVGSGTKAVALGFVLNTDC